MQMRMRVLFGAASVVAVVGMLWGSVAPAGACICAVQTIETRPSTEHAPEDIQGRISVERYLKGIGPADILVVDDRPTVECGFFDDTRVGHRFVLFLTGEQAPFVTGRCSGTADISEFMPGGEEAFVRSIEGLTGPGALPSAGGASRGESPDRMIATVVGPLALLVGAAFLWRRSA